MKRLPTHKTSLPNVGSQDDSPDGVWGIIRAVPIEYREIHKISLSENPKDTEENLVPSIDDVGETRIHEADSQNIDLGYVLFTLGLLVMMIHVEVRKLNLLIQILRSFTEKPLLHLTYILLWLLVFGVSLLLWIAIIARVRRILKLLFL